MGNNSFTHLSHDEKPALGKKERGKKGIAIGHVPQGWIITGGLFIQRE